jgi:hypothetical protein
MSGFARSKNQAKNLAQKRRFWTAYYNARLDDEFCKTAFRVLQFRIDTIRNNEI